MRIFLLLMALIVLPNNIKAYEPYSNVADKQTYEPYTNVRPKEEAELLFDFASIPHATIQSPKKSHRVRSQGVTFEEGHAVINFKHYLNANAFLRFDVGYEDVHIKWSDRFRARHNKFQNAVVGTAFGCSDLDHWDLQGDFLAHIGMRTLQGRYISYDIASKNRYKYSDRLGLHVGAIGLIGMHYTRVYPIVGFDYVLTEKALLSLVYPLDMFVRYVLTENWVLETGVRTFFSRQRMAKNEPIKRGVIAYTSYGFQIGAIYTGNNGVKGSIHIGQAFKGRMRVSNRHDTKRHHYCLGSTPYFGLGLEITL